MRTFTTLRSLGATAIACAAGALCFTDSPRAAYACGGTFCDIGPRAMPVDQTGENILFVIDSGKVEAHIQIQYRGDAARFSWILPVPALPEIEVGSDPLFAKLLQGTVPTFGFSTQRDSCGGTSGAGGAGGGFPGGGVDASAADGGSGPPVVVAQKQVGAFEATTLSGGADEVVNWLSTNGYQMGADAPPLFQDYVARGYLFVAVKLTGGAGIDEIHPLVVRYTGSKPCVPIKLTKVAAVDDMGIRTFFLGTGRVGPINFKSIELNPVRLDWMLLGSNYKELVSRAVDSPVANGKAFVTEYAGPTAILGSSVLTPVAWDPPVFATLSLVDAVNRMKLQGFLSCASTGAWTDAGPSTTPSCLSTHPLVLPLLRDFVPPPASLSLSDGGVITDSAAIEGYIYGCPSCYASQMDTSKWNAPNFAAALADRVVNPSRHADSLLATWPYLTRMFTTISPAEMTEDPEFEAMPNLPQRRLPTPGVRRIACNGASGMTLPDTRSVALTPMSTWPGFTNDMPWAEKIEELPAAIVLVDNTSRINELLKLWNDSRGWPPAPGTGGAGGLGGSGGTGGSTSGGTSGGTGGFGGLDAGAGAGGIGGSGGVGRGGAGGVGGGSGGGTGGGAAGSGTGAVGGGGAGGGGGVNGGGAQGGASTPGGAGGSAPDGGSQETIEGGRSGCGCALRETASARSAFALMMVAGVALRRTRRRR
jgi:MYXO-CTERM domain-containing protein